MQVAVVKNLTPTLIMDKDVRALLSSKLQIITTSIAGTMALGDLGFDSLGLSDLAEAIEERFDVQVPNRTLPATITIDQLVRLLSQGESANDDSVSAEPAD
jgi:acyl carrier protein